MASARRELAVPLPSVRSNNLRAAGVKESVEGRGVQVGGPIGPLVRADDRRPGVEPPSKVALVRRLLAAVLESRCPTSSRAVGSAKWKGVEGVATSASLKTRGVALRVPQVISSLTAVGPSSEGEGDGNVGTKGNPSGVCNSRSVNVEFSFRSGF